MRRPWVQHRRENRLKPSWQTLVEQAIISTDEENSVRDWSCCLSFVIGIGFCQIGSWQHSSFFQVGIWESVKAVHPSPGSFTGKGIVRMEYDQEWIYLQELISYWLTALICVVLQLCLSNLATSVTVHGMSPHQIPDSFHNPRQGLHSTLRMVSGILCSPKCKNAGSVTKIAEALGETKHPFCFADFFACAHNFWLNQPCGSQGNKLIYAHLIPFMRASSNTPG